MSPVQGVKLTFAGFVCRPSLEGKASMPICVSSTEDLDWDRYMANFLDVIVCKLYFFQTYSDHDVCNKAVYVFVS